MKGTRVRVCFISGTRYGPRLTQTQAKKLAGLARDADVRIVALSESLRPRVYTEHATLYLIPAVRVPPVRYAAFFVVAPILALWCTLRHGSNIIVAQSPYEGWVGSWVKRGASALARKTIALVVESHGDFEKALFLQRGIKQQAAYVRLMRAAARAALRDADALRAISSATREQLRRLGATQPIVEFPTWSDTDVFLEAGGRRAQIGEHVLYAGVVTRLKGVHHLIAAFAAVPNRRGETRLIVVGRCQDPAYRRELDRQIEALKIGGAVTFVGEVPQSDLAAEMTAARVLVLPSYSEGLGRVLFEAMAVGTPVIGSAVGGIPDLIENGVNGFLVAPGMESALTSCLTQILADDDLCRRMGAAGRARALSSLSTERYFSEYRRLFELARDRAGRR